MFDTWLTISLPFSFWYTHAWIQQADHNVFSSSFRIFGVHIKGKGKSGQAMVAELSGDGDLLHLMS